MTVTIYHNPRCTKSRQTFALLREHGHEPTVVLYLDTPPSADEILELADKLGKSPLEFTRTKEARFKELGLTRKDARPDDEWARILSENPTLIERPIVVVGDRAALGRPPEDVLEIL